MVIDELIEDIQERFRTGQRRNEIKEDLMTQGYDEDDIEDTIAKIQHDVIKQLPGLAWIYRHIEHFETHPSAGSPKMTMLLMIGCVAFLVLVAASLYFFFDPLGTGSTGRDIKRQSDATIIENGLTQYFQKTQHYPDTLDEMVPGTLSSVPRDPQSGAEYSYQPLENNDNFKLCIVYEQQPEACHNATPVSSQIPVIPTDTPIPAFVPQSASGSASNYGAN
jgi:hypothetical protein